jgi:DNA-damage-inducible protein D
MHNSYEPQLATFCLGLNVSSKDGKLRTEDCANTEAVFRFIQSIPSPKTEPFKRWLARAGYERPEEIENPESAAKRMRELYRAKETESKRARMEQHQT